MYMSIFAKSAGLPDRTGIFFHFCPTKTFSLSDKCPVNLNKENNSCILTTNMPSVLQILICPAKDFRLSDSCPVEKNSRRLYMCKKCIRIDAICCFFLSPYSPKEATSATSSFLYCTPYPYNRKKKKQKKKKKKKKKINKKTSAL